MKSRYLTATLVFAFVITALHIFGYIFPDGLHWGFHFTGFLPPLNSLVLLLIWIGGLILILVYDVQKIINPLQLFMEKKPYIFLLLCIAVFIAAAFILRVKVPLLGDSFYIVKHYADVSQGKTVLDPRNEPLASFMFYLFMSIGGKPGYNDFLNAFFFGELILGAMFILASYVIVKHLFTRDQPRLLGFLFLLSLPYMQLFFGYVENYSLVLTMLSLYLACAILILQGKLPFYALSFLLILNLLSHFLSSLLILSFLFIAYDCILRRKVIEVTIGGVICLLAFIVSFAALQWDYTKIIPYSIHNHFLSVATPKEIQEVISQPYRLLSFYHIIDLLNYAALMAPAIIALIIVQMLQKKKYLTGPRRREQTFLIIAFLPVMAFIAVAEFDLGAARDWDVFAPHFFILAILTLSMFFEFPIPAGNKIMTIVLGLSLIHSITMFTLNSYSEASITRYKSLFDKRNTSQFAYYTGALYLAYYNHQVYNIAGGIDAWSDYIKAIPNDNRGYQNLLSNLDRLKNPPVDIIISTYEKWTRAIPENKDAKNAYIQYLTDAGNAYFNEGYLREAQGLYAKALKLEPSRPELYNNLGSAFAEQGKTREALAFFQRAIQLDPDYAEAFYNMGNAYSDNNEYRKAKECLKIAAEMGNEKAQKLIEANSPPGPMEMANSQSDTTRPRYMD
jgi:two-component SAPR family response regulator